MREIKLTQQSEAIFEKLREEFRKHVLTADELMDIREALQWKDSLEKLGAFAGVARRFVFGLAIFLAAIGGFLSAFPGLKKLLRLE